MYNLYVNDIVNILNEGVITLFADDTSVLLKDKNLNNLINKVKHNLKKFEKWFSVNQLNVNTEKTKILVFRTTNKPYRTEMYNLDELKINGKKIEIEKEIKFLGITINDSLKWNNHISELSSKISKGIGIMYRLKTWVTQTQLKQIYYSFVHCHLTYCIGIWGNLNKTELEILQKLQNKAVRIIIGYKLINWKWVGQNLGILPIKGLYEYNILIKIHKRIYENKYSDFINLEERVNTKILRQNHIYKLPKINTDYGKKNINYYGVKLWENIDDEIKNINILKKIKVKLKDYLIRKIENDQ